MTKLRLTRVGILAVPALIFLAVYAAHAPRLPLPDPDSDSYLHFAGYRTGGYPAFLGLLQPLVGSGVGVLVAQLVLYAAAVLALAWQLCLAFDGLGIALTAEAVLLLNRDLTFTDINRFHFAILTESLVLSLSALFLAAALSFLRRPRYAPLIAGSLVAGYAAVVRPAALVFVPAAALLACCASVRRPARTWLQILIVVAGVAAVLGGEALYYRSDHPGSRQSLLPVQIIGRAGMIGVRDPDSLIARAPPDLRPLETALENALAPVRKAVAEAPNLAAQCWLLENYEGFVEYAFAPAERAAATAARGPAGLTEAGFARLRAGIPDYVRVSLMQLRCLWTLGITSRSEIPGLAATLEHRTALPFPQGLPQQPTLPSRAATFLGSARLAAMAAIAAVLLTAGIGLIVVLCRRRQPSLTLATAGLCGFIVHGAAVLSAFAGIGIPRYLEGLWVPVVIGTGMALLWIAGLVGTLVRARRDTHPAAPI